MEYVGVEMKHFDKFFVSISISVLTCQYYGFYLFAGWRGVITALINMIIYGLIAIMFERSADRNREMAAAYRAQLHNAIQDRDNMENQLYNAKKELYIHGLRKIQ
jgi:hypothetical protein